MCPFILRLHSTRKSSWRRVRWKRSTMPLDWGRFTFVVLCSMSLNWRKELLGVLVGTTAEFSAVVVVEHDAGVLAFSLEGGQQVMVDQVTGGRG